MFSFREKKLFQLLKNIRTNFILTITMTSSFVLLFTLIAYCQAFTIDQCPSFKGEKVAIGIDEKYCYIFFDRKLTFSDSIEFCSARNGQIPYSLTRDSPLLYNNIRILNELEKSDIKWVNFWTQGISNCGKLNVLSGKLTHEVSCSGTRQVACQFEPTSQWSSPSSPPLPHRLSLQNTGIYIIFVMAISMIICEILV